jgi:3-methyladenine DNA glycosylase AlkD
MHLAYKNNTQALLESIQNSLLPLANEYDANGMQAYMKNKFTFLGIKAPIRKEAIKHISLKEYIKDWQSLAEIVSALWHMPEREYQYIGLDILVKYKKYYIVDTLSFLEELIQTKSWWDTVDGICTNAVGAYFLKYPKEQQNKTISWMNDNNMWIRRCSIIHQNKFKQKTNFSLLEQSMIANLNHSDFFIKKAIGWALRDACKVNPTWVENFTDTYYKSLSRTTLREVERGLGRLGD